MKFLSFKILNSKISILFLSLIEKLDDSLVMNERKDLSFSMSICLR